MLSLKEKKEIYIQASNLNNKWPSSLKKAIKKYWQKTLKDDELGLISGLTNSILASNASSLDKKRAKELGLATLYFWTAANLQDDIFDQEKADLSNITLADACSITAISIIYNYSYQGGRANNYLQKLLLQTAAANFLEIKSPKTIPLKFLAPADKSLFLLIGPLTLSLHLGWSQQEQEKLLLAGKYFLSAKQLADDLYDYEEDWLKGRRNFAHRGLKKLPNAQQLPKYYQKQAKQILYFCKKSKTSLESITSLSKKNCFDPFLLPLETNCKEALAKIKTKK